ncbi:MAG: UDP-N-acetylmuramoyl-tripeptide--D-alanyl-D-alanine ligase, partial [Chlorobiales bacterium]|nr:UDP-N-acetylmuramoyl-tripeptide--D-alanyl-D-alanine ligase [Chlorobiales bacterium]
TYNANPDSLRHALDLLCELPVSGKRVAVIGDMLELGDKSTSEHRSIGRYASGLEQLDSLYTFGEHAVHCCKEAGMKCLGHFTEEKRLQEVLSATLRPGDVLLLKGSRGMRLERFAEGLMKSYG